MIRIRTLLTIAFIFSLLEVNAQQKRALTHEDYDGWETLSSDKISKNGQWVGYEINPQEGDGRLEIVSHNNPLTKYIIPRASRWSISIDSRYVVGKIAAQKDSVKLLKLEKTKADDLPKDSLFVLDLASGKTEKLARVKSFSLPEKEGNWLAIHFEKELEVKSVKKTDGDTTAMETAAKQKPKKTDGTKLLVRSLDGQKTFEYETVKNFGFSENGDFLYYVKATEDTLKNAGIFLVDLKSGISKIIDLNKTDYFTPAFSKTNKFLTFLTTEDSLKSKKPYYDLYLFDIAKGGLSKIADKDASGLLPNGMVSKTGRLSFSEDESRLYFGASSEYQEFAYEEDTTLLDEERVSLDIWGWQDAEIQPMQLVNKNREKDRSYLASFNIKDKKIVQIGDENLYQINVDRKAKHKIALATNDSPYRRNYSWDIQIGRDLYLVNLETGDKSLIKTEISGNPQLSPGGKYAYWFDNMDSSWVVYDIVAKTFSNQTKSLAVDFHDELHDSPSLPGSYGNAGWMADDKAFLVYDRFDIWKLDPSGKEAPLNLTKAEGRNQEIIFRRQVLNREEEGIDPKEPLILTAFQETDKRSGYFKGDISGKKSPEKLLFTDHRYFGLTKAEDAEKLIVRRSTYLQSPEIFAAEMDLSSFSQLSTTNPQQSSVNWGNVELIDFLANDGIPLQGLLFKPENFDPNKKYPMMVYFYERNSDGLHNYRSPAPSASTINIPYFVSNDYLVFVPDIKYDLGLPGPSAYNCIIPGVQAIVAKGYVDIENMAIQGQSWGGYQVAYLITKTNMFKAAGAGAPVVNMTSAYGGIRWGTGMSRMFQYEQTQSRIGGTLWEKPLYYIENSPLFFMDRVKTPVLIMHNDADGSVPWYQGIEMFMALKRLNQPAWLLQYNGEDHNLKERKNRKDLSVRLSQFFDHYLKGAPAPLWMTQGLPAVEKGRTLKYELGESID